MQRVLTLVVLFACPVLAHADVTITNWSFSEANTNRGWVIMGSVTFTGDANTSYNVTLVAQSATTQNPNEWTIVKKLTPTTDGSGNCSVSMLDLNGPAPAGDPNNGYNCCILVTGVGDDTTSRSTPIDYIGPYVGP